MIRPARPADVDAICAFGRAVIPPHYTPLIGAEAAEGQLRLWWQPDQMGEAVDAGLVVVAEDEGRLVGVGQRGEYDGDHVIWKLYLDPSMRGEGLGVRMIDALIAALPDGVEQLHIEHFAGNERAGKFYEREGFAVHRIDESPSGDPARATVWRVRTLAS